MLSLNVYVKGDGHQLATCIVELYGDLIFMFFLVKETEPKLEQEKKECNNTVPGK